VLLALVPLVLGIAVGLIRGGRFENISGAQFRRPWLVFAGLILQVAAQALARSIPALQHAPAGPVVLMISYAFLIAFVVLNLRYPGTLLIGLGLLLNLTVILANGAMPVSLSAARAAGAASLPGLQTGVKHHVMGHGTHLDVLGDIIPVPQIGIVSIGDIVLAAGIFLLVQRLVSYRPNGATETGAGESLNADEALRRTPPADPGLPPAGAPEPPDLSLPSP
jgi:hypothetical protein